MSSNPVPSNSMNVSGVNPNSINMNPPGAAILLNQNHQMGQNIQLPSSMVNSSNVATNSTTYILNPSTTGVTNLQPSTQIINTSQINQMIAASPLITQPTTVSNPAFQIKEESSDVRPMQVATASNGFPQTLLPPQQPIVNGNDDKSDHLAKNADEQMEQKPPTLRPVVVLDKQRLQELVQEVDPNEQLEEEVEDVLLSIADDFIESLVSSACMIARHRKSNTLDVNDVQLALEKNWNMWIPGFGVDGVVGVFSGTATGPNSTGGGSRAPKKCLATEAHKQRLALIKKTLKKF